MGRSESGITSKTPALALLVILSAVTISACALESHTRQPTSTRPPPPGTADDPAATTGLQRRIEEISAAAPGRVGAAAAVLETGESIALRGHERFAMASVYKLPIAMAVFHEIDRGGLSLEQKIPIAEKDFCPAPGVSPIRDNYPGGAELTIREMLRFMIVQSDSTADHVFIRLLGGPGRITSYLRGLGVNEIVVALSEKDMWGRGTGVEYRNWASPQAAVELLRALDEGRGLTAESRASLLQMMAQVHTGAHRLKGLLPAGAVVAHKTGSSVTVNGLTPATNDVGLITLTNGRHLAIAVFVADSNADTRQRDDVIATIARAAWDFWAVDSPSGGTKAGAR